MGEKRKHPRRKIERYVRVIRADGVQVTCELADISRSGVRLGAKDVSAIPDEFLLVIDEGIQRRCRVVGRDEKFVRCVFIGKEF
jgi:hypothetical protein